MLARVKYGVGVAVDREQVGFVRHQGSDLLIGWHDAMQPHSDDRANTNRRTRRRGGNHCCGSAPRVSARAARKCASAPARQGKCAHTFSSPTCTHSPEFADELGDGAGAGDWVGEGAEPEPEPEPEPADDGAGADIGDAVTL